MPKKPTSTLTLSSTEVERLRKFLVSVMKFEEKAHVKGTQEYSDQLALLSIEAGKIHASLPVPPLAESDGKYFRVDKVTGGGAKDGEVTVTFNQLVRLFGKPATSRDGGEKTKGGEFLLTQPGGEQFVLYCYQPPFNPATQKDRETTWSISVSNSYRYRYLNVPHPVRELETYITENKAR